MSSSKHSTHVGVGNVPCPLCRATEERQRATGRVRPWPACRACQGSGLVSEERARQLAEDAAASPEPAEELQVLYLVNRQRHPEHARVAALVFELPEGEALVCGGKLSRVHSASSYGLPVLLDAEGQVVEPGVVRAILLPPEETEAERQLLEGAFLQGFELMPA